MKKLLPIFLLLGSLYAKGQTDSAFHLSNRYIIIKADTIPCKLLVSNIQKKNSSGVWVINGYAVISNWSPIYYLGRNRKPVPDYIHVWQYTLLNKHHLFTTY